MQNGNYSNEEKNELALLMLLCRLKEFGFETQRLKLQKLVYLFDIFGTVMNNKPTSYTFTAYKYGPFTKQIFRNIERLTCIDAVTVTEIGNGWDDPDVDRSFEYKITPSKFDQIRQARSLKQYEVLDKCIQFAVQAGGSLSGEEIRKLVYCEPNYLKAKNNQFGAIIDPQYSCAKRFKEIAKAESKKKYGIALLDEEVVWVYINFLKELKSSGRNPLVALSKGEL